MSGSPSWPYHHEQFTDTEREVLGRYFTNLDGPVFALTNLPEVVKGALFARYSRSPKSLRRLFLDEFYTGDDTVTIPGRPDAGQPRAEQLYATVFNEYGDDSVAQLGSVHLACEQASNLLTKILEWGRLAAYLEQSTRYIAYTDRVGGRYRYYQDPDIAASEIADHYTAMMDEQFAAYTRAALEVNDHLISSFTGDLSGAVRRTLRAKALDAARGILPAATLSNLGIHGTGQSFENLLLRMFAHPLPEARSYAELILAELDKVIPDFVSRLHRPERGDVWVRYLHDTAEATAVVTGHHGLPIDHEQVAAVRLVSWDPDAERAVAAAILFAHSNASYESAVRAARQMSDAQLAELFRVYNGERVNRRHKPGRALEEAVYRFEVVCDYGAFRDLQRHRMMTVEWQPVGPFHGYDIPDLIVAANLESLWHKAMSRGAELYETLRDHGLLVQAQYAIPFAYRMRWTVKVNARALMHLVELRSQPQGHPSYRSVAQQMHSLIADQAGHRNIAAMMRFVNHSEGEDGRLKSEMAMTERTGDGTTKSRIT